MTPSSAELGAAFAIRALQAFLDSAGTPATLEVKRPANSILNSSHDSGLEPATPVCQLMVLDGGDAQHIGIGLETQPGHTWHCHLVAAAPALFGKRNQYRQSPGRLG